MARAHTTGLTDEDRERLRTAQDAMGITDAQMRDASRQTYEERLAAIPLEKDNYRLDTRLGRLFGSYSVDYYHVTGEIDYLGHRHYLDVRWVHEEGKWQIADLTFFNFVSGEHSQHENKFLRAHGKYLLDLSLV